MTLSSMVQYKMREIHHDRIYNEENRECALVLLAPAPRELKGIARTRGLASIARLTGTAV